MEELAAKRYSQAASLLHHIGDQLMGLTAEGRYTVDEDGSSLVLQRQRNACWTFRCNEWSVLYALSAYQSAVLHVDHVTPDQMPRHERMAEDEFCLALRARPEIVAKLSTSEPLSARAQRVFDRATTRCASPVAWSVSSPELPRLPFSDRPALEARGCEPQNCHGEGPCAAITTAWKWNGSRCEAFVFGGCTTACQAGGGAFAAPEPCREAYAAAGCDSYV